MARYIGLLFVLGYLLNFSCGQQYHRETKSSKANRLQREIPIGAYPVPFNQQYAALAVEDGNRAAQNTQLFLQHLAGPQSPLLQQYSQYAQQGTVQVQTSVGISQAQQVSEQSAPTVTSQNNHVIRLVDQYGNLVGEQPGPYPVQVAPITHQVVAQGPVVHHSIPAPTYNQFFAPGPVVHQVAQPAPAVHQVLQPAPVYHQAFAPAPVLHHHLAHPAPAVHQVLQPAPVYHEVVAPGPVLHHHLAHPAPAVQVFHQGPVLQQFAAPPAPVVHEMVYPVPVPQIQYQPLRQFIPQAQPFLNFQKLVQPVAVDVPIAPKLVLPVEHYPVPVVQKTILPAVPVKLESAPELHIIKQPILPPAVFQKQIFAIKNPPIRVLTYSDLCTVYPYQRKLKACVIKKGQLPELHHPDIQLVSEQSQYTPTKVPSLSIPMSPTKQSQLTTTASDGNNIQDILRRNGDSNSNADATDPFLPLDPKLESPSSEEKEKEESKQVENLNSASSDKKEKQVKRLRISRTTTTTSTSTTTTEASTSAETTKKPKRRSTKRRSQRKQNSSTTEKPFKLA